MNKQQQQQQQQQPQQQQQVQSVKQPARSAESVGIGPSKVTPDQSKYQVAASVTAKTAPPPPAPPPPTPTLIPEGASNINEPMYDSIVYLIYCTTHDRIAVTNVSKCHTVWLPFVQLQDGMTWSTASHEGVQILIGRNDPEQSAEVAERSAPIYDMQILHILRIQMPYGKTILRLSQFVRLKKNPCFHCCINTDRVNWISFNDMYADRIAKIWGPEIRQFASMLISPATNMIEEFTVRNALYYLFLKSSPQQFLLKECGMSQAAIFEIYTDFVEHCYPSFYMCYESFRAYLVELGFINDESKLRRLFQAFAFYGKHYIDFHEFLIGLVVIEPGVSASFECRSQFIFRYYDLDKKETWSSNSIQTLIRDANPQWTPQQVSNQTLTILNGRASGNRFPYDEFKKMFTTEMLDSQPYFSTICRSVDSNLQKISYLLAGKHKEKKKKKNMGRLKAKRVTRGTCWNCRTQQYEYGSHQITIDTEGRCVEPSIVATEFPIAALYQNYMQRGTVKRDYRTNRFYYSLEYVFTIGSIPNIFLDLVRVFYVHKDEAHLTGLMATKQDWPIFEKYLNILVKDLMQVLTNEPKIIKLNAPVLVIGDLQGNLHDLMQLEKNFFKSFPVIPENLCLLGNYSGQRPFGVECLIFLFSLKLCSPNKVVLLRGTKELNSKASERLGKECSSKYGQANGKILFDIFLKIFTHLPIGVIIDDQIFCTPSGIPRNCRLEPVLRLPNELINPQRDGPIAFEVSHRYINYLTFTSIKF